MDYINATTTGILSPHLLPVQDLRNMLKYIEDTLPSTMHLPISSEDTLDFLQISTYPCPNHRCTIPLNYRCANTGLHTANGNL